MKRKIIVPAESGLAQFLQQRVEEKNDIVQELRKGNKEVFNQKGKKLVQPVSIK